MVDERRKYPRFGVSFPVECTTLPSRKYFYTVTKDLSLGGARIVSNNFLPKEEPFKVNVNLIDKVIDLEARVAWCKEERRQQRYSAGLRFQNLNQESKKELSHFIQSIYNA
ncbi:MAG: PilZ domain-containing protein [Candidatus Omnitrophica bacterium]|nr:PilZ domain-containing protein [Candidatus Omnitrophota bacterium]MCF7887696.1 PilZ domain-containing protein [Candidatus Omnitrophota bacterium]